MSTISSQSGPGHIVSDAEVAEVVAKACPAADYADKKILLIVPDSTRTAPVGTMFKAIFEQLGEVTAALDVLIALGTHQPMSEEAICERLEISVEEHAGKYNKVQFHNHAWDNPEQLRDLGTISAEEINELSDGLFSMDVPVEVNKLLFEYDQVVIVGPVFPHEVVGFSGGNKYLFPGVAGPRILNFFHWLGAVVTNPMIIGNKWTPVRKVVDKAGSMVEVDKLCFCMVVEKGEMCGLFAGTPEGAWDAASEVSRQVHITYKDKPFHTVLSCAPKMYDEIWTAGKCMYKLEPVVADGGHLIIYAPHVDELCFTHHDAILRIGYHCRDYFLKQWDKFKDEPWGVMAHSTHVYGIGEYEDGVETPRVKVSLATQIPEEVCKQVNLGYIDPATINPEDYANREEEGVLYVPKAGEMLFHQKEQPKWAGGE